MLNHLDCSGSHGNCEAMAVVKSKRERRRHVQQALFRRGGKRRGAGRKPRGVRAGERHEARPEFKPYHGLHVVMRVAPAVSSLRRRKMYKALRDATITAALRECFRIVHISLQRTHVHMLVEAEHKAALARGMQGFQVSAARNINTALGDGVRRRRGKVFADRYHLEVITTPTRARHALSYILSNWRKHGEDREGLPSTWLVAGRSFFQRHPVPRLAGAGRPGLDVANPRNLRPAGGPPAANVVAARGLEARRGCDQRPRCAGQAALTRTEPS
jgi:REP element-mobilizing transposase RayT